MPTSETLLPHVYEEVQKDTADFSFRTPVVDDEMEPLDRGEHESRVDQQWRIVSAVARLAVLNSPEARKVMTGLAAAPLTESLPGDTIKALGEVDPKTKRIATWMRGTLGEYLALDAVPDEAIGSRLKAATKLRRKDTLTQRLVEHKLQNPDTYQQRLADSRQIVQDDPGISDAERGLVGRRYGYARDAKLIALMAEVHDTAAIPERSAEEGVTKLALESSTRLVMTNEAYDETPTLLDPKTWQERTQLKDRVYSVKVGDEAYIMKERKTGRHTDTVDNIHRNSLTAQEEFETAKKFADLGVVQEDDIRLRWEKPLGYVEFPDVNDDGYQFTLFENEPDIDSRVTVTQLADKILESKEHYAEEFEKAKTQAKKVYEEHKDLLDNALKAEQYTQPKKKRFALTKKAREEREYYESLPPPDELTFEEFATVKAYYLVEKAHDLFKATMREVGYVNSDNYDTDYASKIRKDETGRIGIDVIGFDFEYYEKIPQSSEEVRRQREADRRNGKGAEDRVYKGSEARAIMIAGSYAMLKNDGWELFANGASY